MARPKDLRDAAKGCPCGFQIPGVCNGDWSTTVLCHLPHGGGVMGGKSPDILGSNGCSACHDVIDGRAPWPEYYTEADKEYFLRKGHNNTLLWWFQRGFLEMAL